jgi:hypothetical protein
MAQSEDSIVNHGMSGKMGDIIVFSHRDRKNSNGKRFQQATIYGKSILEKHTAKDGDSDKVQRDTFVYCVAVADLIQAPDIEEIDLSRYTGQSGEKIYITVAQKFKVTEVAVSIYNPDDSVQEEGQAKQSENKRVWVYTTVTSNRLPGDKITIQALDLSKQSEDEEDYKPNGQVKTQEAD